MLTDRLINLAIPSGLSRTLTLVENRLRTTTLHASAGAPPTPIAPESEFAITVDGERLTCTAFVCSAPSPSPLAGEGWGEGASAFTIRYTHPARDLHVRVTYTAVPTLGVLRKHIAITGHGLLTAVELDHWPITGARGVEGRLEHKQIGMGPLGLGQPLFWNGFFLGVEHPGAENWVTPDGVVCRFPCCHELSEAPFVTPPCVLGTARAGGETDAFLDYIDRLRPQPEPPFVTLINNWYQFGRLRLRGTAQLPGSSVLDEMRVFAQHARADDLPLDFYCLDDPWADTPLLAPATSRLPEDATAPQAGRGRSGLWDRLSPELFPGGLDELVGAAAPMRVGLWVGPIGGYLGRARLVPFGKSLGYETWTDTVDDSGFGQEKLCCHAPRYHAHVRESLVHWTRQGVRYWKFDGIEFHCSNPTHGHPVGPGAYTAQMDAWIALMQAIRHVAPDSTIAFTTGSNPSPWWLPHVDFVWRGGGDDRTAAQDAPKRERFATYIDDCLHLLRQTSMPISAVVVFGLIQNGGVSYASETETPAEFERALWLMVARGTQHHDLYISPDVLAPWAWPMLARVLRWARDHRHVLARSRMVLGEPMCGEVYGFASWRAGRGVVAFRNPSSATPVVNATWRDLFPETSVPSGARLALSPVYGTQPAGTTASISDPIALTLPPFGVAVVDVAAM